MAGIDPGNVASWVTGLASVGALIISTRVWLRDKNDRKVTEASARRAQAQLVSGWLEKSSSRNPEENEISVKIKNGNDNPITGCVLKVRHKPTAASKQINIGTIPPNMVIDVDLPGIWPDSTIFDIHFTDFNGITWHRDWSGRTTLTGISSTVGEIRDYLDQLIGPKPSMWHPIRRFKYRLKYKKKADLDTLSKFRINSADRFKSAYITDVTWRNKSPKD